MSPRLLRRVAVALVALGAVAVVGGAALFVWSVGLLPPRETAYNGLPELGLAVDLAGLVLLGAAAVLARAAPPPRRLALLAAGLLLMLLGLQVLTLGTFILMYFGMAALGLVVGVWLTAWGAMLAARAARRPPPAP